MQQRTPEKIWALVAYNDDDLQRIRLTGKGLPKSSKARWRRIHLTNEMAPNVIALFPTNLSKPNGFGLRPRKLLVDGNAVKISGQKFRVVDTGEGGSLVLTVPMGEKAPNGHPAEVIVHVPHLEIVSQVVYSSLILGSDGILIAPQEVGYLLRIPAPSSFLIDDWQLQGFPVYEPVSPTFWREVGFDHPWSEGIRPGKAISLAGKESWLDTSPTQFRDVFHSVEIQVDERVLDAVRGDVPHFPIPLRWAQRDMSAEPELWVMLPKDLPRLERLLKALPSSDLASLRLSCVRNSETGDDRYVVRESLAGQQTSQYLDFGVPYYSVPGVPTLYIPIDRILEPPVPNRMLAALFEVRAGFLTIVDPSDAKMHRSDVPLSTFRKMSSLVEYLVHGSRNRFEGVLERSIFDLGPFSSLPKRPAPRPLEKKTKPKRKKESDDQPGMAPEVTPVQVDESEDTGKAKTKKAKTPRRKRKEEATEAHFEVTRNEVAEAEARAVDSMADPGPWIELAELKSRQGNTPESEIIDCLDHAWWISQPGQKGEVGSLLDQALQKAAGNDTVLTARKETIDLDGANLNRLRTTLTNLRESESGMSKKARWISWSRLLEHFPDEIEAERVRGEILQELSLYGVGDPDSFPFVRRRVRQLLDQDISPEYMDLLDKIEELAGRLPEPEDTLEILGRVATARVLAGEPGKARKFLDSDDFRKATSGSQVGSYPLSSCAACAAQLGDERARGLFDMALDRLDKEKEGYEKDKTLLGVLDQLRIASLFGHEDHFLDRIMQMVQKQSTRRRCIQINDCAGALVELGGAYVTQNEVQELLLDDGIRSDGYFVDTCLKALATCQAGRPLPVDITEPILTLMLSRPSIDGSTAHAIGLCVNRDSDEGVIEEIRAKALTMDEGQGKALLEGCLVQALAVFGHVQDALEILGPSELVRHLLPNVGHLGRPEGVEIVNRVISDMEKADKLRARHQGEILNASSQAVTKLGREDLALDVIEKVVDTFEKIVTRPNTNVSYLFEVMSMIVGKLGELQDRTRSLEIVERAISMTQQRITMDHATTVDHPYFLHQARLKSAVALFSLDSFDRGMEALTGSARHIPRVSVFDGRDKADLCLEAIRALSCSRVTNEDKVTLLSLLVETGVGDEQTPSTSRSRSFSTRYRRDVLRGTLKEVVHHHSAYRLRLAQIRAEEERIIRNLVLQGNLGS
jgi:hypothetical protein